MVENTPKMDPKAKAIAILFLLLIIGVIVGLIISFVTLRGVEHRIDLKLKELSSDVSKVVAQQIKENWRHFTETYSLVTITISMNILLLFGLLYNYYKTFKETKSNFIFGLILFLGVLFFQSLLSLPIIQYAFGQTITDLGIINILPNLFETLALIILYYLSNE